MTILLRACCAKMCIFCDIALINDSVGLCQLLVILWPFSCHNFWYLNIFQSAPNLVQIFLTAMPRDVFFFKFSIFTVFIEVFCFLELNQFLRWNLEHFQIEFLWFLWGKWTILRLFYQRACCAKKCNSWDITLINDFLYNIANF